MTACTSMSYGLKIGVVRQSVSEADRISLNMALSSISFPWGGRPKPQSNQIPDVSVYRVLTYMYKHCDNEN